MKAFIIFLLTIGFYTPLKACECVAKSLPKTDSISYKSADIVLIGTVSHSPESGTYKVNISRIFKGKLKSKQIIGVYAGEEDFLNNCTFYPQKEGEYLLYFNEIKRKEGLFYFAEECSGNRSLDFKNYPNYKKAENIKWTKQWLAQLKNK